MSVWYVCLSGVVEVRMFLWSLSYRAIVKMFIVCYTLNTLSLLSCCQHHSRLGFRSCFSWQTWTPLNIEIQKHLQKSHLWLDNIEDKTKQNTRLPFEWSGTWWVDSTKTVLELFLVWRLRQAARVVNPQELTELCLRLSQTPPQYNPTVWRSPPPTWAGPGCSVQPHGFVTGRPAMPHLL